MSFEVLRLKQETEAIKQASCEGGKTTALVLISNKAAFSFSENLK